jgi:hypothetical protein
MKLVIAYFVVLAVGALFSEIDVQFGDFTSGRDTGSIVGFVLGKAIGFTAVPCILGLCFAAISAWFRKPAWLTFFWTSLAGTLLIGLGGFLPHATHENQKQGYASPRPPWIQGPVPSHQDPAITYRRPEASVNPPTD